MFKWLKKCKHDWNYVGSTYRYSYSGVDNDSYKVHVIHCPKCNKTKELGSMEDVNIELNISLLNIGK